MKGLPITGYAIMVVVTWLVGVQALLKAFCLNQCSAVQYILISTGMFVFAAIWPWTWLMVWFGGLTKRLVE